MPWNSEPACLCSRARALGGLSVPNSCRSLPFCGRAERQRLPLWLPREPSGNALRDFGTYFGTFGAAHRNSVPFCAASVRRELGGGFG
jgi:hypothetical protein